MIVLEGPWHTWDVAPGPKSVTIGVLDGVHLGHRALLRSLDASMTRTVLTFDPHPIEVLRPGTGPRLLTTIEERVALLESVGVDIVGVLDLRQIKEQSPSEFVTEVLVAKMGATQLVVGEDFRFGKDRAGDVDLLVAMGADAGFGVDVVEIVDAGGEAVSSSRIRQLIEAGDVRAAANLLGSRFTITNRVVDGDKRGREIGFPTANLFPPVRKVIPANGVYACFATLGGQRLEAAVNVGVRPTFGENELLVEAYILDFDEDIYGRELTLEFVEHLRPELTFPGVGPLVERMNEDVAQARDILAQGPPRM